METIDFQGLTIRKWTIGHSTFLACPERGARLMNWHVRMADDSVRDVIYWPEDADYRSFAKIRGGNPVLFPFCARSYVDGKIGYWKAPDGTRLPMPNHGLARQGTFELTDGAKKGFEARFVPDAEAKEAYPFEYDFRVRYYFEELALHVDFVLQNKGDSPLPWSAGHHFYFALPWHEQAERGDYRVELQAKKAFYAGDDGQLVPVKGFDKETRFNNPDLNDRIHCKLKRNEARFGPLGGEEDIRVLIGGEGASVQPWNAFTTWTEAEDSPFYCVEPWMGPPNAPEHGNGLHYVEPGKSETFSVTVSLA